VRSQRSLFVEVSLRQDPVSIGGLGKQN